MESFTMLNLEKGVISKTRLEYHYHLGLKYKDGLGVEKDESRAMFYFEKAAYRGHMLSQYELGMLHFSHQGDAEEEKKALSWFEKASCQGHKESRYYRDLFKSYSVGQKEKTRRGASYKGQ